MFHFAQLIISFFQQCDSNNKHQWTNNNNLQCSDNNIKTKNDRCVNGACVGTPYNCLSCERHDGNGGCPIQSGYCIISYSDQRTCFANNQYKPGNPCQVHVNLIIYSILVITYCDQELNWLSYAKCYLFIIHIYSLLKLQRRAVCVYIFFTCVVNVLNK